MLKNFFLLIITSSFLSPAVVFAVQNTLLHDFVTLGSKYSRLLLDRVHDAPPVSEIDLTSDMPSVYAGECITLSWFAPETAMTCFIEPGIGEVDPRGSIEIKPKETTTYKLTAALEGKTLSSNLTVNVINPDMKPSIELSVDLPNLEKGEQAILRWTSRNAELLYIDDDLGIVSLQGSLVLAPEHTKTYNFIAIGPGGTVCKKTTIRVLGKLKTFPENSFCKQYESIIPGDATLDEYDVDNFSVIKARIKDIDGYPLKGVSISVFDHPEYGSTVSGTDGVFQIPVECTESSTIVFQKEGYFTSYKKIDDIKPNTVKLAKTLIMGNVDPISTKVSFDGNPNTVITHTVKQRCKNRTERQFKLVFTGDNMAYLADQDGQNVLAADQLNVHLTLFDSANESPGISNKFDDLLFTHFELTGEGLPRVNFKKPVILWMENYLNHDVGKEMITSNFNPTLNDWEPEKSAVIVKLLDLNKDGVTDALDANGDDRPDDLNSNGYFEDEVAGLDNSEAYLPGKTLVRMEHLHFSTLKFKDYPGKNRQAYETVLNDLTQVGHFLTFILGFIY